MTDDNGPPIKGDPSYGSARAPDASGDKMEELTPADFLAAVGAASDDRPPAPPGMEWQFVRVLASPPPEVISRAFGGTYDGKVMTPAKFKRIMQDYRRQNTILVPIRSSNASAAQHDAACAAWEKEAAAVPAIQAHAMRRWFELHPEDAPPAAIAEPVFVDRSRGSGTHLLNVVIADQTPAPDSGVKVRQAPRDPGLTAPGLRIVKLQSESSAKQVTSTASTFRGLKV